MPLWVPTGVGSIFRPLSEEMKLAAKRRRNSPETGLVSPRPREGPRGPEGASPGPCRPLCLVQSQSCPGFSQVGGLGGSPEAHLSWPDISRGTQYSALQSPLPPPYKVASKFSQFVLDFAAVCTILPGSDITRNTHRVLAP